MNGVVNALVRGGLDPAVLVANPDDLGDFPAHVIGDTEPFELALLVERVDGRQRLLEGNGAIRGVCEEDPMSPKVVEERRERTQVPHIDLCSL